MNSHQGNLLRGIAAVLSILVLSGVSGCGGKKAGQDFDAELCYWVCKRDQHEFTCTFDEYGAFQTTGGHPGQPYNCPRCGKNDQVVRLPDTPEVIARFRDKSD